MEFVITPGALTLAELRRFGDDHGVAVLSDEGRKNIRRSQAHLEDLVRKGHLVYGVNTGFGPLSSQRIGSDELTELQRRVVLSNATGVGSPLSERVVRRIMLLKVATLAAGASGAREALADTILSMLNAGIVPVVPEKGSAGASGDLAPLAHIGAALIGEGDVFHRGERKPAARALQQEGACPLQLGPKEGLALVNGTQVSTALAIEGLFRLEELLNRV
jgi:histidine ammonia-lyase